MTDASIKAPAVWTQVSAGALLMLATLPGRTQGLGLITEPLLADLHLSREVYAQINLWATLGGALVCLPAGAWMDRFGLKAGSLVLLPSLAMVVLAMSHLQIAATGLFVLVLLSRALGQGAMSVLSLAVAGRSFKNNSGGAAGAYGVLLSVLFAIAFVILGGVVRDSGWRSAWDAVGYALLLLMPLAFVLRNNATQARSDAGSENDLTLAQSIRIPAFWAYCLGIAAFAGIAAATGLFNEAILAERGFDQEAFHHFLAGSSLIALIGQIICGIGMRRLPIRFWLGGALIVQAVALALFRVISTSTGMWTVAALMGLSGGIITVAFFAIWGDSFGKRHLGRIQGVAQTCSVLASALGPLLLERGVRFLHGYANTLIVAAPVCVLLGLLVLTLRPRPVP
jgi:MFS family permease